MNKIKKRSLVISQTITEVKTLYDNRVEITSSRFNIFVININKTEKKKKFLKIEDVIKNMFGVFQNNSHSFVEEVGKWKISYVDIPIIIVKHWCAATCNKVCPVVAL